MSPDAVVAPTELRLPPAPAVPSAPAVTTATPATPAVAPAAPGPRPNAAAAASSFERAMQAFQREQAAAAELITGTKRKGGSSSRRRGSVLGRFFRMIVVLAVLGGVGYGGWYVYDHYVRADGLPTFPVQPEVGSVTVELVQSSPTDGTLRLVSHFDGGASLLSVSVTEGAATVGWSRMVLTDVFGYLEIDGVWHRAAITPEMEVLRATMSSYRFADLVPDPLRSHTTVKSVEDVQVNGTPMRKYELALDMDAFAAESPAEQAAYVARFRGPATGIARWVLTVDDQGLIWEMATYSDVPGEGRVDGRIVAVSPELPQIQIPASFVDDATGQMFG